MFHSSYGDDTELTCRESAVSPQRSDHQRALVGAGFTGRADNDSPSNGVVGRAENGNGTARTLLARSYSPSSNDAELATQSTTARNLKVSLVLPTMNEERNIGWVLGRLPAGLHEVLLVDGRSVDRTVAVAQQLRPDIRVLEQKSPGKGAALALGLTAVTGDIVVMIDADGSMDPAEIPGLVGALLAGADVVKGSRATAGGGSRDLSTLRKIGNWALTFIANRIYRQNWRELCYGYAAFWTDVLQLLNVSGIVNPDAAIGRRAVPPLSAVERVHPYGHGFEIEALLFCRAARARLRVAEVFSFEHERRNGESNLATWRDGWRVLTAVLRERRFHPHGASLNRQQRSYPVIPYLHDAESNEQEDSLC